MVSSLTDRLTSRVGSHLLDLLLFGSCVAGDNSDEADWDLLVVVQENAHTPIPAYYHRC